MKTVRSGFSLQMLDLGMTSVGMLVTGVASIVVLWYGGHRVIAGGLTIGELMFFSSLLSYMLDPLERLAGVNLQIQDALVAMHRVSEVTDLDVEETDADPNSGPQRVESGIRLENVSFGYGCRGDVLSNVSFDVPAGAKVAIVGESGSGKSTLLKLLMRFYDPSEGRVLLDGTDYRDIDLASLRKTIGLVAQEPFVFTGTIRENIALGAPQASMDEIVAAARAAGLEAFIGSLPDRYQTVIGERGANLSGGQRQRLAIARALLRKPELLVFDEATSHLDTATEQAIKESLRTVLSGKTVVLVAHRLSTIQDADIIYVLHDGRIVEQGNHQRLMADDGRYAALWRAQTELPHPPVDDTAAGLVATQPAANEVNGRLHPCVTT